MKIEDLRNKLGPVKNLIALAKSLMKAYPVMVPHVESEVKSAEQTLSELLDESELTHDFLVSEMGFDLIPSIFIPNRKEYIKKFSGPDNTYISIRVEDNLEEITVLYNYTDDPHDVDAIPVKPLTKRQFRNLHDIYSI